MQPLFTPGDDGFRATPAARGPWDPDSLHGGPLAALLTRALEGIPAAGPMSFTRVTIEILRPVGFGRLEVDAESVRPGRRVELLAAVLRADGAVVARASAWRVRRAPESVVDSTPEPPALPPPEEVPVTPPPELMADHETFASEATEHRFATGGWGVGPCRVWMRLRAPLLPGEPASPLQSVLALADYGNGVSAATPWETHTFVNTDLTAYFDRAPVSEWVGLDARTRVDPAGFGLAESVVCDPAGRLGRSLQGLYVDRRG